MEEIQKSDVLTYIKCMEVSFIAVIDNTVIQEWGFRGMHQIQKQSPVTEE